MVFYTIQSETLGRFCGFKRKAKDFWLRRPIFRWDTFPHEGKVMIFLYERQAYNYIRGHPTLPYDCTVRFSDLDAEGRIYNLTDRMIEGDT
jgi:hypothetical protein